MVKRRLRKLTKKDFTKEGAAKIIKGDFDEINQLSKEDLLSLWSFFKFLVSSSDKKMIFATMDGTLIARHKEVLIERGIGIQLLEDLIKK